MKDKLEKRLKIKFEQMVSEQIASGEEEESEDDESYEVPKKKGFKLYKPPSPKQIGRRVETIDPCDKCQELSPDQKGLEHRDKSVDAKKSLAKVRDKQKNPCFQHSKFYVHLNRTYQQAKGQIEESLVSMKPDSPTNCNLSFYKQ